MRAEKSTASNHQKTGNIQLLQITGKSRDNKNNNSNNNNNAGSFVLFLPALDELTHARASLIVERCAHSGFVSNRGRAASSLGDLCALDVFTRASLIVERCAHRGFVSNRGRAASSLGDLCALDVFTRALLHRRAVARFGFIKFSNNSRRGASQPPLVKSHPT